MSTIARPSFAPPTAPESTSRGRGLTTLIDLFRALDAVAVIYCHWKSNEHLAASLAGDADLDLLVARPSAREFTLTLAEHGFKRFSATPGTAYPGVEDYLGFDAATGCLTHLHVHYELTLGERYLKGYRVPWEHAILARRVRDRESGVWCADPASELVLLLLRAALKLRWRDRVVARWRAGAEGSGLERERQWLLHRTDVETVAGLATERLGPAAGALMPALLTPVPPTPRQIRALQAASRESLAAWRRFGPVESVMRRWWRELSSRTRPFRRRMSDSPARRVLPRGGALIGFVGADGSGKSTLSREIERWLSWKLDVVHVYGGSGRDSAGVTRSVMERVARAARPMRARNKAARAPRSADTRVAAADRATGDVAPPLTAVRTAVRVGLGRVGWIVALAVERRQRGTRSRRARNRGMVVLSDRLPQSQFAGINDGPHLGDPLHQTSPLRRAAARYERQALLAFERVGPDLVVRLHLPYEVAARRKPDTPPQQLRNKLAIIGMLHWPPETQVADIDASRPLPEVLLDVKRAVWEVL